MFSYSILNPVYERASVSLSLLRSHASETDRYDFVTDSLHSLLRERRKSMLVLLFPFHKYITPIV